MEAEQERRRRAEEERERQRREEERRRRCTDAEDGSGKRQRIVGEQLRSAGRPEQSLPDAKRPRLGVNEAGARDDAGAACGLDEDEAALRDAAE